MITKETVAKFQEIADLIFGDDEIAIEVAMEDVEAEDELFVCFDDYSSFEPRLPKIEEACWARGLTIERQGGGYVVKEDTRKEDKLKE